MEFLFDEHLGSNDPFLYDIYKSLNIAQPSPTSTCSDRYKATSRPQSGVSAAADASDMLSLHSSPSSSGSTRTQDSPKTPAALPKFMDPFASPFSLNSQYEGQSLFATQQDSFLASCGPSSTSTQKLSSFPQTGVPNMVLEPAAPIMSNYLSSKGKQPLMFRNNSINNSNSPCEPLGSTQVRRTQSAQENDNYQYYPRIPASTPSWSAPLQQPSPSFYSSNAPRMPYTYSTMPPMPPRRPSTAMALHTPPKLCISTFETDPFMAPVPKSAPAWQTSFNIPPAPSPMTPNQLGRRLMGNEPHFYNTEQMSPISNYHDVTAQYLGPYTGQQDTSLTVPPRPRSAPHAMNDGEPVTPTRAPKKRQTSRSRRAPAKAASPSSQFVNFTSADASKLLTGVAPSGSSKRKREEEEEREAAAAAALHPNKRTAGGL